MIVTAPSRRRAYVRNLQRQRDVAFIGKVIHEYQKTMNKLPDGIEASPKQICRQQRADVCAGAVMLPVETVQRFATSTEWLGDPQASTAQYLGYVVFASSSMPDGFLVQAPRAELGVQIAYPR